VEAGESNCTGALESTEVVENTKRITRKKRGKKCLVLCVINQSGFADHRRRHVCGVSDEMAA